jgi:hypothetical protein
MFFALKQGQYLLILVILTMVEMLNFMEIQQFESFSVIWKITKRT